MILVGILFYCYNIIKKNSILTIYFIFFNSNFFKHFLEFTYTCVLYMIIQFKIYNKYFNRNFIKLHV